MRKLLLLCLVIISTSIYARKLPKDALDTNVAFIFDPDASVDNNKNTLDYFTENIIEYGFNLVGVYLHTDSTVSLKEIEFDIKNKDVKYLFLLNYKYYKGADYDLYYFENDGDKNQDVLSPKKEILKLKPGFIHTSTDFRKTIIEKLEKEVDKLKEEEKGIDNSEYDEELLTTLLLNEDNIAFLNELNNKNTIVDGATLTIDNNDIPAELKTKNLAVIGVTEDEYRNPKTLNSILKSQIKKYPFSYTYFKDYDEYSAKGGDSKFDYRLQLTMSNASMLSISKPKYTSTELYRKDSGNTNIKPTFSSTPINYQKDLFAIVIKNNKTGERHLATDRNFLGKTVKNFVGKL